MTDVDQFGPMESADESATLKTRLAHLELREKELEERLQNNESEFGQKRAKFMELFKQKETELKTDQDKRKELEEQLSVAKSELDDIKMAVSVSEANKEEEIAKIRRQCQQEIETMQALMKEAAEEASSSTALQYESERVKLQKLNENYEEEIQSIRSKLSQERTSDKAKSFLSSIGDIVSRGTASLGVGSTEAENLEESMRKAQHDAEILKSVVLPLENEITKLKEKVRRQEDLIDKQKEQLQEQLPSVPQDLTPTAKTSLPSLDDIKDPEEKILQLMNYLKTEKAARMDLEMYVAVLNTQKNTAQDETDSIKAELKEEEEKRAHDQLKRTWQMANDQFLESQRLMMMDMRRMENLLSAEQQRMLAEQQQKDLEREAQEKKVKELEEKRLKEAQDLELLKSIEAVKKVEDSTKKLKKKETSLHEKLLRDKSESNTSVNSCGSGDFSFDDSSLLETGLKKSHSDLEISSISEQEFLDNTDHTDHETRSLQDVESVTSIRISPEKVINLPSLTEAQYKAITDHTIENEARKNLLASAKSKKDALSLEGRRLVSDKEWLLLQEELKTAREKLGRPCDMCNNYEAQLQGVQDELKAEQAKLRSMDREMKAEKQTIESQKKYIQDLEESLKDAAENANAEITSLVNMTKECEKYMSELRQQQNSSQMEINDQLKQLINSQEAAQKEMTRLEKENDDLQGKHSKHAEQLQNEDINLPNNLEDMQLLLLKYREEIIAAKVDKEHTEEKLRSELIFLKDQAVSEQQERNRMEEALTQEINSLQERLAIQDSLKSELERESSVRAESESKLREAEQMVKGQQAKYKQLIHGLQEQLEEQSTARSKLREAEQTVKGQQAKYKQLIHGLQKQLEEQSTARTRLEDDTHKMKMKIQSLQTDLDNSEAVQRDFVKLSQSLQIQLEQIRQAETEVRWEYEDDIDDCHGCKQPFTVAKRKSDKKKAEHDHNRSIKHHCRHCGKIFCTDCITKTVNSGPKLRPSKVCDVCHTILVKDATPYFSTEPPSTPD